MHSIQALVSGIAAAANGTVRLYKRGSAAPSVYYLDFEATQTLSAYPIQLDSSGSATVYVGELVEVQVRDANGVLVRDFVAGDNAQAIEVTSPAFSGVDYTSGQAGVGLPTTLQQTFQSLLSSFGTTDYKVLVNGAAVTMQVAVAGLAGLFFNVKSYGATGNGLADDSTAVNAAILAAAATATGGGVVFFPPGTYRMTQSLNLTAGVMLMGAGGRSSKVAFDNAGLTQGVLFSGGTPTTVIQGLWFGATGAGIVGILVYQSATGRLMIQDCTLGADALVSGNLFRNDATLVFSQTVLSRCWLEAKAGAVDMVVGFAASNRTVLHDCDLVNSQATGIIHCDMLGGFTFEACRFDSAAVSGGATTYIACAPTAAFGGGTIRGCFFGENATVKPVAIRNTLAVPNVEPIESDNAFGSTLGFTNITPYAYTTDGYAAVGSTRTGAHLSRLTSVECYGSHSASTLTTNPKANGTTTIEQTTAALTINANKGSQGDMWLLVVANSGGGTLTVSSAGAYGTVDGAATFAVLAGATRRILFAFCPLATGTNGFWRQVAASASD